LVWVDYALHPMTLLAPARRLDWPPRARRDKFASFLQPWRGRSCQHRGVVHELGHPVFRRRLLSIALIVAGIAGLKILTPV
jgi:hypothetical protein